MSLLWNCLTNHVRIRFFNITRNLLRARGFYLLLIAILAFAYTGNATIYYVSSEGNDSNTGTSSSQPWKSLEKVNSFNPAPGDQILFKRGEEWNGTINASASGTAGNPIVYGAYGTGENPKIYGSAEITGWELHSGNIYKATFNSDVEQLFINNKRVKLARYPNSGYFNTTKVNSSTQFSSTDLDGGINYTGATWVGRTTAFTMYNRKVAGSSSQTVTLESSPSYGLGVDKGFFLANKLEFLDQAGEWYYDTSTNTVYLWAPNGDSPANYEVRGSTSDYGVNISDRDYIVIKDFDILHSSNTGVHINKANNITIDNNRILSPDLYGIHMPSNSNKPTFKNNYIYKAGGGIRCFGTSATITDNTIEDTGQLENINQTVFTHDNYATAIYSRNNYPTITYNRIINAGYNGINWKGQDGDISYNYIDGACQVLDDGAGIYTYNGYDYNQPASAGSVVKNNIVLNVYGKPEGYEKKHFAGFGIYMDNAVHHVTIENNTVAGVTGAIFINPSGFINVKNNTLMDATLLLLIHDEFDKSTITDNIFFTTNRGGYFKWWGENSDQRIVYQESGAGAIFDDNKYFAPYETNDVFVNMESFAEWKSKTGQDTHSTFDGSPFAEGETEQLFYNDTKQTKTFNLGNSDYRDIDGNKVSEKLTLEPFTSKILIGTNFDNISGDNQNPEISDQSFDILAPKTVNDFVGQVSASDPDAGQTLSYSIVQGNEDELFTIDTTTGDIVINSDIQKTTNQTIDLIVEVTDDADNPLSASANVTIDITGTEENESSDNTAPTISSFSIPETATSLTVSVSNFSATDDTEVTGYQLTETSSTPTAGEDGWTTSAPADYTFSQSGEKKLFAWVKDAAGNISSSLNGTVIITLSDLSSPFSEYLFEESSGATVIDSQGSNNGTILNEETRTEGVHGNGLEFTGSGYINLGESFGENVQNEVTLSAWIKPTATRGSYQGIIMHGGPNVDTYALYINPDMKSIAFKTSGTSSFWLAIDNVDELWDGEWHHLTVTYNGNEKITYLDNAVLTKIAATGTIESGKGYNLLVGAGRDDVPSSLLYRGMIDEVRIYNYALTSSEISELYNLDGTVTQQPIYKSENISICEGEEYMGWTESGEYERILQSESGADSIVTTNLWVNPVNYITEDITIYKGETYEGWNKTGEYERVLESVAGCDSIVTTNLTVLNGNSKKEADNVKSSGITTYNSTINSISENDFLLYPNPARSFINVDYSFQPEGNTRIQIMDANGRAVLIQPAESVSNRIDINQLSSGLYYLRSVSSGMQKVKKFIIK
ncbi:MAG: LamG-like jellyroll fold domain-containing protein [Bacteroidota bacterium]